MSRFMALALCFVLPTAAHAASLKDFELSKMLEKVAKESSVGTPAPSTKTSSTRATPSKATS